jgi:hypothetical protein
MGTGGQPENGANIGTALWRHKGLVSGPRMGDRAGSAAARHDATEAATLFQPIPEAEP